MANQPDDGHVHMTFHPNKNCSLCGADTTNMICIGAA